MLKDNKEKVTSKLHRLISAHILPAEKTITGPRSKTWTFQTDPLILTGTDGKQLYKLDTLRFTILEDLAAQYTQQWNATSLGWSSQRGPSHVQPDIVVEIQNAQGGVMDKWDIGPQEFVCGSRPVIFQSKGLVGVLDLASVINLTIGHSTWTPCY